MVSPEKFDYGKVKGPIVVAAYHYPYADEQDQQRLLEVLDRIQEAGGNHRMFIEGSQEVVDRYRPNGEYYRDRPECPFKTAINEADKRGWEVIPLGTRKSELTRPVLYISSISSSYANTHVRERWWARTVKLQKADAGDIIVMFPYHVRSFIEKAGISFDNVVEVNPAKTDSRFSESQIRTVREELDLARKERIRERKKE